MERVNDKAVLCGNVTARPVISHSGREGTYYTFPLEIERLSGVCDTLNIIAHSDLISALEVEESARLRVEGEVRSFNNRSGSGPRLVLTVLARTMRFTDGDFVNDIYLSGTICKAPGYRRTPMGREICDIMLAVNRRYGRSDYLPCIVWGTKAREASRWGVGTAVELNGRMQSRIYIKNGENGPVEKTAFEISAAEIAVRESAEEPV